VSTIGPYVVSFCSVRVTGEFFSDQCIHSAAGTDDSTCPQNTAHFLMLNSCTLDSDHAHKKSDDPGIDKADAADKKPASAAKLIR